MKHLMTQSTRIIEPEFWQDQPSGTLFRFLDDTVIWKVLWDGNEDHPTKIHIEHGDTGRDVYYKNDQDRPIVFIKIIRVTRAGNSIYKDIE